MIFSVIVCTYVGMYLLIFQKQKQLRFERESRLQWQMKTRRLVQAVRGTDPFFACPACAAVSYSLADLEHGWCGACQKQTCQAYSLATMGER